MNDITKQLQHVERVIADPLRFKASLEIGEGAYRSLTIGKNVQNLWDVASMALTGAQIAKSATVATAFFTTTSGGIFGFFVVTTAVTPIGWVVAASVVTAGIYYGIMRMMKGLADDRIEVVPKFINTPIDILAFCLFDLIAPLALKVAAADGKITLEEREVILSYFVNDWGYDKSYVNPALKLLEQNIDVISLELLTEGLRKFTNENKDCNHRKVRKKIVALLREVAGADGELHEMEELSIQYVAKFISKDPWFRMPKLRTRRKAI